MNLVSIVMRVVDPVREFWHRREEDGASLVEYALLLAVIELVALIAMQFLGTSVQHSLSSSGSSLFTP